ALVLHEHAGIVAAVDRVLGGAAVQRVLAPVHAGAEQMAFGQAEIGLCRCAVAVGLGAAEVSAVAVVVGFVVAAAGADGAVESIRRRVAQFAAPDLLPGFGVVVVAGVLVLTVGAQGRAFDGQGVAQCVAAAQAQRLVAVAVAVGLVGEAAGEQRARAAAGIDA